VPLSALQALPGARIAFAITVTRGAGDTPLVVDHLPGRRLIELRAPEPDFDAAHWRA
jgi:hypothetical protein